MISEWGALRFPTVIMRCSKRKRALSLLDTGNAEASSGDMVPAGRDATGGDSTASVRILYIAANRGAVAAGFLAYKDYEARNGVSGWAVVLGTIAVLFNPIIPIHLSREIWLPINAVAAAIFGVHWMKSRKQ